MCMCMVDIRGEVWQIYVVVFVVCSESKQVRSQTQRLLASLICSERAEFKDDSAVAVRSRYIIPFIQKIDITRV